MAYSSTIPDLYDHVVEGNDSTTLLADVEQHGHIEEASYSGFCHGPGLRLRLLVTSGIATGTC
jgi:hypothetical protein